MNFDIDIAIVVVFLTATMSVGLLAGRGVTSIKDYALGNRNFTTAALVATIVSTKMSGSGFYIMLSKTYSGGWFYIVASSGMAVSLLFTAFYLLPKMSEFLGKTSIAEAMGDMYGDKIRLIVAICGIISPIGSIAVQFKVFGNIFQYFFSAPGDYAIYFAAGLTILYSSFGGLKSVTYTDMLQFFVFGISVPIVGLIIWNSAYNHGVDLSVALKVSQFNLSHVLSLKNPNFWTMILLMLYFIVPCMTPTEFQRIAAGKNIAQVKKALIISAIVVFIIKIAITWIPFAIYQIDSTLDSKNLLSHIINTYSFTGLKGLLIVGVIAMAMSTADSKINSSSVLFANDVCKMLGIKSNPLFMSKIASFAIGGLGIYLAVTGDDLLDIIMFTASFYTAIVGVPWLMAILGFRTSALSVYIGMAAGTASLIIWKIFNIDIKSMVLCMSSNFIFLMGSHYLLKQKGGWVKKSKLVVKSSSSTNEFFLKKHDSKCTKEKFISYLKKAPTDDISYVSLGLYFLFYTLTTMYSTQSELLREDSKAVLIFYQIMLITSISLSMYPLWAHRIKNILFVQIGWNIAVFYMLNFFSMFFVLLSQFSQLQSIVFTLNMMLVALLTGWRATIPMLIVGYALSIFFYKLYSGFGYVNIGLGSSEFLIFYSLVLIGAALIIFLKPKQEYLKATEEKVETLETETVYLKHEKHDLDNKVTGLSSEVSDLKETVDYYDERDHRQQAEIGRLGATAQKILNNVNHELRLPIGNVMNFSEMLRDDLEKYDKKHLKIISDEVYQNSNRLSSMILNMLDLATLNANKLELDKKLVNLSEIVEDRVKLCRKVYLQDKSIDFKLTIQPEIMLSVDPNYFKQTIDNLVINAINFSEKGIVEITLKKDSKNVNFIISDQGKGIPPNEIYDVFTAFQEGSNTASKAQGRGVGLALCKAAIRAHGGDIEAESRKVGALIRFVIPV